MFQPEAGEVQAKARPAESAARGGGRAPAPHRGRHPGRRQEGEAARLLGISRVTLWKLLKAHDIQVDKIIRG